MTYGQLRLRISKLAGPIDGELLDGWIQDVYTEILDRLPWKRTEGESVFEVPPSYAVGTASVTQGSTAVVGTGTTWTSAMTGRIIRVGDGEEFYQFTYVSATTGTLDRNYEGVSTTDSYRIDQNVFLLPASLRVLRGVRALHPPSDLTVISPAELNRIAPGRTEYGNPEYAAYTWDALTDPPIQQVELYPIPDCPNTGGDILSFVPDYVYDQADLDSSQTSVSLLPWVRPGALIAGVQAAIATWKGDTAKAELYDAKFEKLVKAMEMINAQQRGQTEIRLAPELRRQTPGMGYPLRKRADRDYFGGDD